ncbi:MAG TPA: BatE protein, partial [Candidatus Hydrogenedentes bacterium]|nr:BatE protein [Candidatus Hydrogenedentota bacterium]
MNAVFLAIAATLAANGFERSFDRALEEYKAGDYVAAAATYEQLIAEDIVHPAVFYNLGNAYYR